jgi:hypothetical protein
VHFLRKIFFVDGPAAKFHWPCRKRKRWLWREREWTNVLRDPQYAKNDKRGAALPAAITKVCTRVSKASWYACILKHKGFKVRQQYMAFVMLLSTLRCMPGCLPGEAEGA